MSGNEGDVDEGGGARRRGLRGGERVVRPRDRVRRLGAEALVLHWR